MLTIILFISLLLVMPFLLGYALARFLEKMRPDHSVVVTAQVRLLAQISAVGGALVSLLAWKAQYLSHEASLMAGAIFFWPGIFLLTLWGDTRTSQDRRSSVGSTAGLEDTGTSA